jgi:riboflavin-specific deaminase-like protein
VDLVFPHTHTDVDPAAVYAADDRSPHPNRPWVALNMVASADGAVTVDGRSGGLSGPADKAIFFGLRAVADVVLVGAGTVRAEDYGPPRLSDDGRAARTERGQAPFPTIAVVSGRLDLDPTARLFVDTPTRPIVLTGARGDRHRRAALETVADVVTVGDEHVDPTLALAELSRRGAGVVICEGGPTLNGTLLGAGLVDELCLSVAPLLASGDDPRIVRGPTLEPLHALRLDRVLVDEGFAFFRYLVER